MYTFPIYCQLIYGVLSLENNKNSIEVVITWEITASRIATP